MRRLIIHIGAHKTGSTAIQKFFFDYTKYFEENFNLIYPIENQTNPEYHLWGHHYLTWYFVRPKKVLNIKALEQAFSSFIVQISSNKEKDFLISSEDFIWNYRVEDFINEIKSFFDDIYILIYVRRQVDAAISLYQTGVVNSGLTISFHEWFEEAKSIFDYWSIVERYEKLGCKVIVRPYMRNKFEGGDVILDFLKSLSSIVGRNIVPPDDYKPNSIKMNVSVPDFICMMIRHYNAQPSKDKVVPVLRELGYKLVDLIPDLPKADFIPPSVKNKIVKIYEDSNRLLCERYLGLEYIDWLNEEIKESDEFFFGRFGFQGSQLVELCKTFIQVIDKFKKEV